MPIFVKKTEVEKGYGVLNHISYKQQNIQTKLLEHQRQRSLLQIKHFHLKSLVQHHTYTVAPPLPTISRMHKLPPSLTDDNW